MEPCPQCGSRMHRGVGLDWFGNPTTDRCCERCGHIFPAETQLSDQPKPADKVAIYDSAKCRCVHCGAANPRVERTMPKNRDGIVIRYHRCKACGKTMKSQEDADRGILSGE